MNVAGILPQPLIDAGQAIGLISASQDVQPDWFGEPLQQGLQKILSDNNQRAALFRLLDDALPPEPVDGAPAGEKWHPLLGTQAMGNVYLIINELANPSIVGFGARYSGTGASLLVEVPALALDGSNIRAVIGSAANPIRVSLQVPVGWTLPAEPIALASVSVAIVFTPAASSPGNFLVTLRGLDLDGSGAKDYALDPNNLASEGAQLVFALIHAKLHDIAANPGGVGGDVLALAKYLVPLLGLDGSLPVFPFTTLAADPLALKNWLRGLVTGSPAPAIQWLEALAGLLGVPLPTATTKTVGKDTVTSLTIVQPNANSSITLGLVQSVAADGSTPTVGLQIGAIMQPSASTPAALTIAANLFAIPVSGSASAAVLPSATACVLAPGSGKLIAAVAGSFSIDSVRAGVTWDGNRLAPVLELSNVVIPGGGSFPVIDLTNANSVASAAASGLVNTVIAGLGATGAAARLASLAGLIEPASDAGAPLVDFTQLATRPTAAIAALHRNALLSASHPWSNYLAELGAMLALPGAVSGKGTPDQPWQLTLASSGPLSVVLAAWNDQTSGLATDPQKLRLGVRAQAASGAVSAAWTSILLAADLPATGTNQISLFAQHDLSVSIVPPAFNASGFSLGAASMGAQFVLMAGAPARVAASIDNLTLTTPSGTISVPKLPFPFPAGFDPQNPAAALGINLAQLEHLLASLLQFACADALGNTGRAVAVALGCGGGTAGLPSDLPALADIASGQLLGDPAAALRAWLAQVAGSVSSTGADFTTPIVNWLQAGLADAVGSDPGYAPDPLSLTGTGSYDDPWRLPVGDPASAAQALLWLEPNGPGNASALAAAAISAATDFPTLVAALRAATRYLGTWPAGLDPTALATGLASLAAHLANSDGVVPTASELPTGGSWRAGTALESAHPDQPADSAAISQVLAQIDAWAAPANPRGILLLGPAFSDHSIWAALLAAAEKSHPGSTSDKAYFNLRLPGVAPASIDLRPVATVCNFYTADLQDDGSGNVSGLESQIGLVLARMQALLPAGAPIMLVAHSTAGVAACSYAASNKGTLKGLVTLGAPLQGAPLTPLTDVPTADALRFLGRLFPAGAGLGNLQSAFVHLLQALDGYLPPPTAGALPIPWPYPVADFDGTGSTDTGGTPALALGGNLGGGVDLLSALKTVLAARVKSFAATAPTHLSLGVCTHLNVGAAPGLAGGANIIADTSLRIDVGRVALLSGAASPARPAQALTASVGLTRSTGWLVGDPRAYAGAAPAIDVRVRSAQLGLTLALSGTTLTATPTARLQDVAVHGPTGAAITSWTDPLFQPALGAVFGPKGIGAQTLSGTPLGGAVSLLQSLGIVTVPVTPGAALGIAADAINALAVDAIGYLTPKLPAALQAGTLPGFSAGATNGTYSFALGALPLEVFVTMAPAAVGLRTIGSGGLLLGDVVALQGSIGLPLASLNAQASVALSAGPVNLQYASGSLGLQIPSLGANLPLVPAPTAAAAKAAFATLLPPLLLSSGASALLDALLGPGERVAGLYSLLQSPRPWLVQASALGDGTALDPAKINALIAKIGALPGGLQLSATGKDPTTLSLSLAAPIGGVLSLGGGITIERNGHASPAFTLGVNTPTAGTWPSIAVNFGVSSSGLTLSLAPSGVAPIQLLPTFDGAAALAGAAKKLLPEALDALVAALDPGAPPPLLALALEVAQALSLYDSVGGFDAHAAQLAAMTGPGWFAALASSSSAFATAAAAYFNDATSPLKGALPGTVAASGTQLTWSFPLPGALGSGTVAVGAGWDATNAPTLSLSLGKIAIGNGPVTTTLQAGFSQGKVGVTGSVGLSAATLANAIGVSIGPELDFAFGGTAPAFALLPLGPGTASTLSLQLAPQFSVQAASGALLQLAQDWALPLAANVILDATSTLLAAPLIKGSTVTAASLLQAAGVLKNTGTVAAPAYLLVQPLPDVQTILGSLLQGLPTVPVKLVADPPLSLLLGSSNSQLGIGLQGSISVSTGSPAIDLLFGQPGDAANVPGVWLGLLGIAGTSFIFAPTLQVRGIGASFAGDGGGPLVSDSDLRIGDIAGFLAFDFDLKGAAISGVGAGLTVGQLGLPLGLLGSAGGSNPVATSLLSSDGGSGSGDASAVNPAVDVEVTYLNGKLAIQFSGTDQPIVIPIHASFGPVYIDQIDLALDGTSSVSLGIDGTVSIAGFSVGVDELALQIPIASILKPADWSIDLQGLAIGIEEGPVVIAGGLRKNPGPPVEYDGMLTASIEELGLTVVGAYSRPSDAQGGYTSLFLFAVLLAPLGGPPMAFVTGLGGGFGFNRELIVPSDLNQLDNFVLVAAMDDDSLANDPMGALMQMSQSIPARRGAFWLAAGARITSFALVNSIVVVSIALDRGLDIEILGLSRMALPTEDDALVSVELALRARFDSAEQILSIQAQLTDNSYLFSRDCQLTGGFAFFVWYGQGQFVLTLGGYNPNFTKPAQFPDVPRLGFNWDVADIVVIKGGAYFALTNSCVMAGGSLTATASIGPVSAWFDAHLDFLVSWDPFSYSFDIGVEIGASVSIQVCFFGCVTIGISISVGADLSIAGPPFHGTASIDAYVTTITISFGDPPTPPPYITDWGVFAGKYLTSGDPNGSAVSVQVSQGLLPTSPPGAQPQPGTANQPWQVGCEFVLTTTTRMPASSCPANLLGANVNVPDGLNGIDLAAMDRVGVTSSHTISLAQQSGGNWVAATVNQPQQTLAITAVSGFFPEATWHWNDPLHLPAAARTISAISGFRVDAHVVLNSESQLIPISSLVDDQPQYALALPFATTATVAPDYQSYGVAADTLAAVATAASAQTILAASAGILGPAKVFSANRGQLGLPGPGLPPLALQALLKTRAAPPLLTPLATGLTMKPVGLPVPLHATVLAPVGSVLLAQPRLRAVLQANPKPMTDAAVAQHTSVAGLQRALIAAAPRMAPPGIAVPATLAGARLVTVPAPAAPRPTRAALAPRALRHADLGAAIGPAHQAALDQAAANLVKGGVALGAGALHLWDVPDARGRFTISGSAAARMICLDRGGATLSDVEFVASGQTPVLPAGTAMVAIQCLGTLPPEVATPASGFGAISSNFAPTGEAAAVGWQAGSTLLQVGPARLLARGASLRVVTSHASQRNGQRASHGMPTAAHVLAGQVGAETRLPLSIGVVMIALDVADPAAAIQGDLAVAALGGTLAEVPQRVATGNRLLLLYDLVATDPKAHALFVSVASAQAYTIGGVVGLHGKAVDWAHSLSGGLPDHFVPDGALAAGGALNVTYKGGAP